MRHWLRNNSLSVALFGLFLLSFVGQIFAGWHAHAEKLRIHDLPPMPLSVYLRSGHFLSATFENWQSEFLSVGVLVVLGIYLRQRGSPELKPVAAPHGETSH